MPITYRSDSVLKVVFVEWSGDITISTFRSHIEKLLDDHESFSCGRSLSDIRNANIKFTGSDLSNVLHSVAIPKLQDQKWKTAILIDRPDQYGTARQYNVYAEAYSTDSIFYDYQTALAWLIGS